MKGKSGKKNWQKNKDDRKGTKQNTADISNRNFTVT